MKKLFKILKITLIVLSVIAFVTISNYIQKGVEKRTGRQSTPYPSMQIGEIEDKFIDEGWAFKIEDKTMNCKSNIIYIFKDKISILKTNNNINTLEKKIDIDKLIKEINRLKNDNNGYTITFSDNKAKNIPRKNNKIAKLLEELSKEYDAENIMTCN